MVRLTRNGYALAVNISRRHMTKGQQALVVARAVFESNTELSRVEHEMKAKQYGISPSRIAYALVILEFATDLADEVLAGVSGRDTGTLWVMVAAAPPDATSTVGERPMVAALPVPARLGGTCKVFSTVLYT